MTSKTKRMSSHETAICCTFIPQMSLPGTNEVTEAIFHSIFLPLEAHAEEIPQYN
jgi:hypothetical protein